MITYILSHYPDAGDFVLSKEAVFTMKLESELRAEFMAEAELPTGQHLRYCVS